MDGLGVHFIIFTQTYMRFTGSIRKMWNIRKQGLVCSLLSHHLTVLNLTKWAFKVDFLLPPEFMRANSIIIECIHVGKEENRASVI